MYSHDLSGTRYSPLTQITNKNVAKLVPAWTYRLRSEAERNRPAAAGSRAIRKSLPSWSTASCT